MLDWAMEERSHWVRRNAAAGVKSLTCAKEGFHSWEVEEVRQFEKRHPVGSTARLAMALTLYTGMRRSEGGLQDERRDDATRSRTWLTCASAGRFKDSTRAKALQRNVVVETGL